MASNTDTYYTYPTSYGPLTLRATQSGLAEIVFDQVELSGANRPSATTNQAATELQEFLAGKRRDFDVPLDIRGSAFQKAVWSAVCEVGYGSTCTAADIASAIGKPGSHRSVGTALRQNLLAPMIPTHRVIVPNATGQRAKIFRALVAMEQRA